MDNVIKNSVRKELKLDDQVKGFVDRAVGQLNLDEVLSAPAPALEDFGEALMERLLKKFMTEYILEGVLFADAVKKSKEALDLSAPVPGLDKVME